MALPGWRRSVRVDVAGDGLVEVIGAADHRQDCLDLAIDNYGGGIVDTAIAAGRILADGLVAASAARRRRTASSACRCRFTSSVVVTRSPPSRKRSGPSCSASDWTHHEMRG